MGLRGQRLHRLVLQTADGVVKALPLVMAKDVLLEVVLDADGVGTVRTLERLHGQVCGHMTLQVPRPIEHPSAEVTRVQPCSPHRAAVGCPLGTAVASLLRGRLEQRRRSVNTTATRISSSH